MKSLSDHTDLPYKSLTSLLIGGTHMGEISKMSRLIISLFLKKKE
jgi:hypothetical protein